MIAEEMRTLLGASPAITAGQIAALHLVDSPHLTGLPSTPEQDAQALDICPVFATAAELRMALATALRPAELFPVSGTGSGIGISPEWLTDIFAAVTAVYPAISWEQYLWELPFCAALHLSGARIRRSGGKTPRPEDTEAADQWLVKRYNSRTNIENGSKDAGNPS
jgi:hypothetical protein